MAHRTEVHKKFMWILPPCCVLLISACSAPGGPYETILQMDPAREPGKVFILALVKEIDPSAKPDTSMADFVLKPGESATKTVGNKYLPNRTYEFAITTSSPTAASITAEITTTVSDGGRVLYKSKQELHTYGFAVGPGT